MNMYIYIHIYICMYVYVYIYVYIHIYVNIYTYIYINACTHIYVCMCIYIHTYTYIYIHIHVYIHIHIHVYIYTYIYIYFYVHPQYSSKRDKEAMRKDVAAKAAMELDDERLRDKFTNAASAFPPKATPQMYRQSHYRLAQEVGMLQPHTITHPTRQLQRVTLQRERLDESSDGMSHASSVLSRTHSGAMARALSREEVLNSSIDVVRDNMNAMNGVSQTSTWNSTMRAADTTGLLPHNVPGVCACVRVCVCVCVRVCVRVCVCERERKCLCVCV